MFQFAYNILSYSLSYYLYKNTIPAYNKFAAFPVLHAHFFYMNNSFQIKLSSFTLSVCIHVFNLEKLESPGNVLIYVGILSMCRNP